jgi:hypothetical protein
VLIGRTVTCEHHFHEKETIKMLLLLLTAVAVANRRLLLFARWRQEAACTWGRQGQDNQLTWQSQLLLLPFVLVQQSKHALHVD